MSAPRKLWRKPKRCSSAKVREGLKTGPRLYTIPPSAPFLTTLARAILAGDLPVPGGPKPDPLILPFTTIYLPTRRAARALREAFLAEAPSEALLLPRVKALGDPDEEAALILGEGDDEGGADKPAIGELQRHMALMRLVLAFARTLPPALGEGARLEPITPAQASSLALDLAKLMDEVEREEIDLSRLVAIVPEEFADHWRLTVEFLKIVTEHWPAHLAENGLASPVARRSALMTIETERLAKGSSYPVIAAGSTGTVPATARLLETIASLPNGAVVLPGLDRFLDDWTSLADHPEHPQAGMAKLLKKLGATRQQVADVPGSAPNPVQRARLELISEALRPAGSTERWQRFLAGGDLLSEGRASFANGVAGLRYVVAPTAHDEAEAIALILKWCIETEGKTAALVTPDRVLARRVAARLKRYGLAIDDSAGMPVMRSVPGAFLDLVLGAVETSFAPTPLMALLKHPLTLLGRSAFEMRVAARAIERGAFRDVYVGEGLAGVREALSAEYDGPRPRPARISDQEREKALGLVADLETAFAPLAKLFAEGADQPAARLGEAHVAVAEALARDQAGSASRLWRDDAGEALTTLLAEVIEAGTNLAIEPRAYPPFYRSLVAREVVRPPYPAHPRLFIWGPLEARLQQPDVVILGSLNEGVWPRPQEAGPWLNRPMREALGLPPPDEITGRSAHDFAQCLGARHVYLTRALKVEGVPTVPSRWLQRLLALIDAAKLADRIAPELPFAEWARERDHAPRFEPVKPPRPCPPVAARPRELSVTRIERWIANPYEIYARYVLELEKLEPLGSDPDQALRGQIVHKVLHEFARDHPRELPADIYGELMARADEQFARLGGSPLVEAFWRPSFARFARWFAATEPVRRALPVTTFAELKGKLEIADRFTLTARADRIDLGEDGSVAIYDYKTGKPPEVKHVDGLSAPQLPLEAVIAEGGGFEGLGARPVNALVYIGASGRAEGGNERPAGERPVSDLAHDARERLVKLVRRYNDPAMPYEVKRRRGAPFTHAYDYDDYAQLARIQEWMTQEPDEDDR
ncbi:MAG TPA: double-strand break repair protein AddB [Methyloceanibacter sp.]|nr:double-strand break repair protein AddB [Methyloceanibacter sp.]